jgi:hypothetical protein
MSWHFRCTVAGAEVVVRRVADILLIVIIPGVIVCALLTPQFTRSQSATWASPAKQAFDRVDRSRMSVDIDLAPNLRESEPSDRADDNESATDLYGNEVTDAVAKYKLDAEGSLYELHSPHTELPHLGSPKS